MKKIVFLIILIIPFLGKTQAHLGSSLSDLKAMYPGEAFKIEYADDGTKYTSADQLLGTFIYYFDKETNLTFLCVQIPNDLEALNAQIEIYNKKYVIISDTSWKAYLNGGGTMKINLTYEEEFETYMFYYTF
jgi:predicted PolB exonuclease-like 3'-5' exonuclease